MKRFKFIQFINKYTLLFALLYSTQSFAAGCSLGGNLNFGIYNPNDSNDTMSSAELTVTCSLISVFTLGLGTGQSGAYAARILSTGANNSDKLTYNLYINAARTSIFGDGTSGTSSINKVSIQLGPTTIPVYGVIRAKQNISAGSYQDAIPIMITF